MLRVFQAKVFFIEIGAQAQPFFETAGALDDVHAGNDSDDESQKSNETASPRRPERLLSF